MYGLGNIFSGLGSMLTIPNLMTALEFMSKGMGLYGQIESLMNPPKMPDFARLDRQGNQPQPAPSPSISPQDKALQFASARRHMAERGVHSGGAFEALGQNPLAAAPGMFNQSPGSLYAMVGEGQALPYQEDEEMYGGTYGGGGFYA